MSGTVELDSITVDADIYPRAVVDAATVTKYADAMDAGATFPPLILDNQGRLLDGRHRRDAYRITGADSVTVEVHNVPDGMTPKEYAASLSNMHGLPLSDGDSKALARERYESDGDASVASVARSLSRSRKTVEGWVRDLREARRAQEVHAREVRRVLALLLRDYGWTQQRIADHLGMTQGRLAQIISDGESATANNLDAAIVRDALQQAPDDIDLQPVVDKWWEAAKPHVSNNSGQNEWYTPPEYVEAAKRVLTLDAGCDVFDDPECGGCVTILDPASSDTAQKTVGADTYYTEADDGLAQDWAGSVWLNPPYAQPLLTQFIDKTIDEYTSGRIDAAIVLVNNATETKAHQKLMAHASHICFPSKRIKYLDHTGKPANTPLQGQLIAYLGERKRPADHDDTYDTDLVRCFSAFCDEFSKFGVVMEGQR